LTVVVVVLAVVVALLAVLVVSLLRSHAEILRALNEGGIDLDPSSSAAGVGASPVDGRTAEGVPEPGDALGRPASDIAGPTPGGDAVVKSMSVGDSPTLVAFLSTGCITCRGFWEDMAPERSGAPEGTRTVIVTQGEEAESPSKVADLAPAGIPVVMSTDAWEAYGIPVAPYFVLVERGVVVGEGAAASWDQVRDLLDRARRDGAAPARSHSRRDLLGGNRKRIDHELLEAGITPGDPNLYHDNGNHPEGTR
jgi:hypothetical protein